MGRQYKYKALNNVTGKITRGQIEATNELNLERILRENGLMLISATEIKKTFLSSLFTTVKLRDILTIFISLEQLERAGVPLIDSIRDIPEYTTNQILKDVGQSLYESLKNGLLLSEAMAKHKKIFDEVSISLVAMGEKTGKLADSFKSIVENLKWSAEIRRKITKAITGPLLTLSLMLVIAVVMLKFVVPSVLAFVLEQELGTPKVTLALVATADFVNNNFLYIVATPIVLFLLIKLCCRNNKFAIAFDAFKLQIPIIGVVIQKIELSRFAKFFGLTFDAGIPVLECLDITYKVVQNKKIKSEISAIKLKLASGMKISICLQQSPYFSPLVVKMFTIGENTGEMQSAISNVNYFYETEINDSMEAVIGALKPIILFMMGGLLIWIMIGVFGPLYGSFSKIM